MVVTVSARRLSAVRWCPEPEGLRFTGIPGPLQGVEVAGGRRSPDRVQEQRRLAVFGDYPLLLQKPHQLHKLCPFLPGIAALHADDRRIVLVQVGGMRPDGLGVPEGPSLGVGVGPVGGAGHPPVVESQDGGVATVV